MTRRSGLSLAEVLVALFLMALGAISILTLFPLGALQMGQALKDDRTTQSAVQADAFMRFYWQDRHDAGALTSEGFYQAMNNPASMSGVTNPPEAVGIVGVSTTAVTWSYPVFVDPMGFIARSGIQQRWVGDNGFGGTGNATSIPRQTMARLLPPTTPFASQGAVALRTCTLLDGLTYDPDLGTPASTGVERDMRYNWLWVLQRKSNKNQTQAEMTIAVFDKRAHRFAPAGSETVHTPTAINGTKVSFPSTNAPDVQKGGWLLDATVTTIDYQNLAHVPPAVPPTPPAPPVLPQPRPGVRNASFYRVVSVTDDGSGTIDIELQTPVKPPVGDATNLQTSHYRFVVLAGLSEVFERDTLVTREPAR